MEPIKLECEYRSDEWQEMRRQCIGASEAAAACGLSPFDTPYTLVIRKFTGEEIEDNDAMWWGRELEPLVIKRYQELTGENVTHNTDTYRHPALTWMIATPDAFIDGPDGRRLLQIKTATSRSLRGWGEQGSDQVPDMYLIQCQHEMAVMDATVCTLALLVDGRNMRTYTIKRDEALIDLIVEKESSIIEYLRTGTHPPRTDSDTDLAATHEWWRKIKPEAVVARWDGADQEWEAIEAIKAEIKEREKELYRLQADWKERMGAADTVDIGGRQVYRSDTAGSFVTQHDVDTLARRVGEVKRKGFSTLKVREIK